MNCEDAACNMVCYYSTVIPVIRHQPVYVQFSNHKELKTDNSPNQEVQCACSSWQMFLRARTLTDAFVLSEGPGSSPGFPDLSCGFVCSGVNPGPEGGGGEPDVPRLAGCSLAGKSPHWSHVHDNTDRCEQQVF